MLDHGKRQEDGFNALKEVLQKKDVDTTNEVERIEDILSKYTILSLDWGNVICLSQRKDGKELQDFLQSFISLLEDYVE